MDRDRGTWTNSVHLDLYQPFMLEKALLNNLHHPFSTSFTMSAETYFTKSPGAKNLSNEIIVSVIFSIVSRNECLLIGLG